MGEIILKINNSELSTEMQQKAETLSKFVIEAKKNKIRASSRNRYKNSIDEYVKWCGAFGINPLAQGQDGVNQICAFLVDKSSNGAKVSTLIISRAAIRFFYIENRIFPIPSEHTDITDVLSGIKNMDDRGVTKKKALTAKNIIEMIDACDISTNKGIRDRLIIAMAFCGAFRRSELSSLRLDQVEFDEQEKGLKIKLPKTKTTSKIKHIMTGDKIPVLNYYKDWVLRLHANEGYVFHKVTAQDKIIFSRDRITGLIKPLNDAEIKNVLKKYAALIGLNYEEIAGHSARRGGATDAFRKGARTNKVRELLGHKSSIMTLEYEEEGTAWDDHAMQNVVN